MSRLALVLISGAVGSCASCKQALPEKPVRVVNAAQLLPDGFVTGAESVCSLSAGDRARCERLLAVIAIEDAACAFLDAGFFECMPRLQTVGDVLKLENGVEVLVVRDFGKWVLKREELRGGGDGGVD